MKATIFLFLLWMNCTCCTHSDKGDLIEKKRLTGRYIFQANNTQVIDVNSDGTYSNHISGEENLKNFGTWAYDSTNGWVFFKNFSFLSDTLRGTWPTKIKTEGNEIRLIYSNDISKGYFLRIDSLDRKPTNEKR